MNKKSKIRRTWIFIGIFIILILIVFINRLFYGIETSDEAFYDVTGYRLLQGNIPYGDMWEQNASDAYFMFPFLIVRSLFVSGTEGIHIYLRLSFLILNMLGLWAIYMYAKKAIKEEYAFLLGTIILFYAPFQLYSFSYNNLSTLFVSASICMMLVSFDEGQKRYSYLSGVFMALGVLAYPTMIYCCVIIAIMIIAKKFSLQGIKLFVSYALGGFTFAVPILLHLSFCIGIKDLIKNTHVILSAGSTPSLSPTRILLCIVEAIRYWKTPFIENGFWFCFYVVVITALLLIKKTKRVSKYLLVFFPLICTIYSIHDGVSAIMNFVFPTALIGLIAVFITTDRKTMLKKLILEWGPSTMVYFVIAFSSGGGAAHAKAGLAFSAVVSLKLIIEAFQEEPVMQYESICIYVLLLSFILCEVLLFYAGVYRDESYFALKKRVEAGVYKGIYTTPERKQHIEDLEDVMCQIQDKEETVMILYHCCYAYLMVDMVPKIPTAWGCIDYQRYGFDNQQLFMEYLDKRENIPENIIIINIPKEYDYAGQQVASYRPYYSELNSFIADHYTFMGVYEQGESGTIEKYELDWKTF